MNRVLFALLILLFFSVSINHTPLFAKEAQKLDPELARGIEEFRARNFGLALAIFLKVNEGGTDRAISAYYLGLAYKELLIYDKAIASLKEASSVSAPVHEALYPLAEIYFDMGKPLKAIEYIKLAEEAGVRPGYTAYLKGLIMLSLERYTEATKAFNRAKQEDDTLTEAADYQLNIAKTKLDYDESHE
jgi:tetratricopeptide (TPR) repeat protein